MHTLLRQPWALAVARLPAGDGWPWWAARSAFASVTRTPAETSVVCEEHEVPASVTAERGFVAFAVAGPIPFEQVGVLQSIVGPLAAAGISCFPIGTFDTDYVLIRLADAERAEGAWRVAGHQVT